MTLEYDERGMPVAVGEEYAARCQLLRDAALRAEVSLEWFLIRRREECRLVTGTYIDQWSADF